MLFEEVFWGTTTDPLLGIRTLHDHYQLGIAELEDVITFLRERFIVEQAYADRLLDVSKIKPKAAFLKSEGITGDAERGTGGSSAHRSVADSIQTALTTLQTFHETHKRLSTTKKDGIDSTAKKLNQLRTEMETAMKEAKSKWVAVVHEDRNLRRKSLGERDVFVAPDDESKDSKPLPPRPPTLQKKQSRIMSISTGFFASAPQPSQEEEEPVEEFSSLTMDVMLTFSDASMTANEFNALLERMRNEIPMTDIKSYLLFGGTYKDCVAGADVLKFMQRWYLATFGPGRAGGRLPVDGGGAGSVVSSGKALGGLDEYENRAGAFCAELVNQGFLKGVGVTGVMGGAGASTGGGHAFVTGGHYQWKRMTLETEPPHKKARREAEKVEADYKKLVKSAESVRVVLEEQCVEYMQVIENAQRERLSLSKTALQSFAAFEKGAIIPILSRVHNTIDLILETVVPEKDLQTMVERDRTGNGRLSVFVYIPQGPLLAESVPEKSSPSNITSGTASLLSKRTSIESNILSSDPLAPSTKPKRLSISTTSSTTTSQNGNAGLMSPGLEHCAASKQVFGVSLEESAEYSSRKVPAMLRRCLKALVKISVRQGPDGNALLPASKELEFWISPNMHTKDVQALREQLNRSGKLPVSVCSHEVYEPLKLLFLSKSDEFASMRIVSLKSLLATLSPPHYQTLMTICNHLVRLIESLDKSDKSISDLAQTVGPILLRPRVENRITCHDKHPSRLLRDIFAHYKEIFPTTSTPRSSTGTRPTQDGSTDPIETSSLSIDADAEDEDDSELDDEVDALLASSSPTSVVSASALDTPDGKSKALESAANAVAANSAPRGFGAPNLKTVAETKQENVMDSVMAAASGAWGAMGLMSGTMAANALAMAENLVATTTAASSSSPEKVKLLSNPEPTGPNTNKGKDLLSPVSFVSEPLASPHPDAGAATKPMNSSAPLDLPPPPPLTSRSKSITIETMEAHESEGDSIFDVDRMMSNGSLGSSSSAVMEAMDEIDDILRAASDPPPNLM
ncbi:hypothetical protein HDV05_008361 [Chytridiales sp. JEL 0842]|nr:hypothetical protein HDV05_008361 [Chytridiales sp. JEL 0842]